MTTNAYIYGLIYGISAVICAGLLTYTITPPVRVLAYLIGAVDVPIDDRRMHKKPTPRLGGLGIFFGFALSSLVFGTLNRVLGAILIGGGILVILGVLDDVYRLKAWLKFLVQIAAALVAVYMGVKIDHITLLGNVINFGVMSIPITVLWIVALTNAINLLDGLDGLACGVSGIISLSILGVVLIQGDYASALITAILAGACFGFLPFNTHPARVFMGDTGALFLGFTLSVISVKGVLKLHTILSFLVPIALFALPLIDTVFAFFRRIANGENPFSADRKHLHHKLVDMGFTQKEAVRILYAVCGILGLVAITFTEQISGRLKIFKTIVVAVSAIMVFALNYLLLKKTSTRILSGLTDFGFDPDRKAPDNCESTDDNRSNDSIIEEVERTEMAKNAIINKLSKSNKNINVKKSKKKKK